MAKTFDELFNEFFKKNNIKPEQEINEDFKTEAINLLNMLNGQMDSNSIDEEDEKELDEQLGKPDSIEFYNEGNVFFEKRTWYTDKGNIVKLIVTDEPNLPRQEEKPRNLQDELNKAVEAEEFEKAAIIRDLINKEKKL
jgi:hypothetical protein